MSKVPDLSLDEFAKHAFKDGPLPPFEPFAWYNEPGDAIEIFLRTGDYVAQRIDHVFTLLLDHHDITRVVGIVIKQIKTNFCSEGVQSIDIAARRARLELLILTAVGCGYIRMVHNQAPVPGEIYDLLKHEGRTEIKISDLEAVLSR